MKKIIALSIVFGILTFGAAMGQALTETTNLRFWEHHSSDINGGANYGNAANGFQSGYDFVNHTFYSSFNTASTSGAYLNSEEVNIDMVEHNAFFGNGGDFGITSGTSSIWNGNIKGNNISLWVEAQGSFDYTTSYDVLDLKTEYNAGTPNNLINTIQENGVYISKIRGTDLFVAMKCYNVTNLTSTPDGTTVENVYFDFDYKYGTLQITNGITEVNKPKISIYPNPSNNLITVISDTKYENVTIHSLEGKIGLYWFFN